jgi:hypothetical protein
VVVTNRGLPILQNLLASMLCGRPASVLEQGLPDKEEAMAEETRQQTELVKNDPAEGTLAATLIKAVDGFDEALESRGWGFNEELMLLTGHDDDAERLAAPGLRARRDDTGRGGGGWGGGDDGGGGGGRRRQDGGGLRGGR